MNLKKLLLIGVALALTTACFAQGGGGFRRGGMFGGGGPSQLLQRKDVQADLALTDEQKAKLDEIRTNVGSQMRDLFQNSGDDRAAAMKAMAPIMKKASDDALAVLTASQKQRLNEINIQLNGNSALINNNDLQNQVGLTDDQKAKIADLLKTQQAANASIMEKRRSGEIQREDAGPAFQKNQQVLKDELDKVLTDAQKSKLKSMSGKPFTAAEDNGGGLQLLLSLSR
jgi:Spy/CpxP family protein refolding chaperone